MMTCHVSSSHVATSPARTISPAPLPLPLTPPNETTNRVWTRGSQSTQISTYHKLRVQARTPLVRAKPSPFPAKSRTGRYALRPAGEPSFIHAAPTSCSASNQNSDSSTPGHVADREQIPSVAARSPESPPADVRDSGQTPLAECTETGIEIGTPAWQRRWEVPWGGRETAFGMGLWVVT